MPIIGYATWLGTNGFKSVIIALGLSIQRNDENDAWYAFAIDGGVIHEVRILKDNGADHIDFESSYASLTGSPKIKIDVAQNPDNSLLASIEPRVGNETIITTHNFCDKVTWFTTSERINDEVLTSSDGYVWNSANQYWVDMISGRVQDDDGWVEQQKELNPEDPHGYQVIIKVDGYEKTMREPFLDYGGDYDVYWDDGYIISFEDWSGKTVTASYSKAIDSTFILAPLPGSILNIEAAEADFTQDVEMYDAIEYNIYGYASIFAPQLGLPAGTKIPIKKTTYKRLSQIFNEAIGAYALIEVLGSDLAHAAMPQKEHRKASRGMKSYLQSIPFRYATVRSLQSSLGIELRVQLSHDIEFEGSLATCTFYCTSKAE